MNGQEGLKKMLMLLVSLVLLGATEAREAIIVVGAPGDDEYAENFLEQGRLWADACQQGDVKCTLLSPEGGADLVEVEAAIAGLNPLEESWLVFIGHGTWDGRIAKFNLRGEDLTAPNLAESLSAHSGSLIVINTSASSAPFLKPLAQKGRVIVTATKSGDQINATHFGRFFAPCLIDPKSDLDGDEQVSLLEAVLSASHKVEQYFEREERLLTEHVLIDDNGDGVGTRADWYRGIRLEKRPKGEMGLADGFQAGQRYLIRSEAEAALTEDQRVRRDALELEIFELRERRKELGEKRYYEELEKMALALALLYRE